MIDVQPAIWMMIHPTRKMTGKTTRTNNQNDSKKPLIASMSFSRNMPNDLARRAHGMSLTGCMAGQFFGGIFDGLGGRVVSLRRVNLPVVTIDRQRDKNEREIVK